jgi:hypothetical protein
VNVYTLHRTDSDDKLNAIVLLEAFPSVLLVLLDSSLSRLSTKRCHE